MLISSFAALALATEVPPPRRPAIEGPLAPLAFLVGHCWRADLGDGRTHTHCFDSVHGDQHVRDHEELTRDSRLFSSETIFSWDHEARAVTFTRWNSHGGVMHGTVRAVADRLVFPDDVRTGFDNRRTTFSTTWRRVGEAAYEDTLVSPETPRVNRTIRYERVVAPVAVSTSQGPDGRHSLVHETIVPAPAAAVWQAIATAEGWRTWAVPVAWAPEPDVIETSYTPTAQPGDPSTIRQRILAAIAGRLLVFRTVRAPARFPNFDTYAQVTSLFELEPLGESRTRVRLTGSGYADTEAGRQLLAFFRDGNRISLERLRQRFETGPLDWAQVLRARE